MIPVHKCSAICGGPYLQTQQTIVKTQHNIFETQHKIIETQHRIIETQHKIIETQHKIVETQHKIIETQHKIVDTRNKIIETQHKIEGFRAKRAYIGFWPIFIFLRDRANFSQTDLFWHETHRSVIALVDLPFALQK